MVGSEETNALILMKNGNVEQVIYLGYRNLSSDEYDRLCILAKSKGMTIYLTDVETAEKYSEVYDIVGML